VKQSAKLGMLALCAALSACSVLEADKVDYKSASKGVSLDVPPDLTQLSRESRFNVPGGTVTASGFQIGQAAPKLPTATTALADIRIERSGNQRWLVVNRPADQLWGPVREFWQENGFLLVLDDSNLGIMETDWAENRAKIPQDFIRNSLGKLFDSLYSTAERDRFRTRLERTPNGGTEIFISHRGMVEVYANAKEKEQTIWQPRPADPELETEFLRKLMIRLGVPQEQTASAPAAAPVKASSRVASDGNAPVVQIDEGFDRAWRRVGLALDRVGFTVVDRDRSKGTYFVRYSDPETDGSKKEKGLLDKLMFWKSDAPNIEQYRITVAEANPRSLVTVQDPNGSPDKSATGEKILSLLREQLK